MHIIKENKSYLDTTLYKIYLDTQLKLKVKQFNHFI